MLDLAAAKREQYRDNAWPFQRPAAGARAAQASFFAAQLELPDVVSLVAEGSDSDVSGMLVGRIGAGPPPFRSWVDALHIDDFAVDHAELWPTMGRELLLEAGRRAAVGGARRMVVVAGSEAVDPPKRDLLVASGLGLEARWWIRSIDEVAGPVREAPQRGFRAIRVDAPPVYDPGGTTCCVLQLDDDAGIAEIEDHARPTGAVLLIVPREARRHELGCGSS